MEFFGGIAILIYTLMALTIFVAVGPLALFFIRFLNQTWFDPYVPKEEETNPFRLEYVSHKTEQQDTRSNSPHSAEGIMVRESSWAIKKGRTNLGRG